MKMYLAAVIGVMIACSALAKPAEPLLLSIVHSSTNWPNDQTDYQLITAVVDTLTADERYVVYLDPSILQRYQERTSWQNEKQYLEAALKAGTLRPNGEFDPGIVWKPIQKNKSVHLLADTNAPPSLRIKLQVLWRLTKAAQTSSQLPGFSSPVDVRVPDVTTTLVNGQTTLWRDEYKGSLPSGSAKVPSDFDWAIVNVYRDHLSELITRHSGANRKQSTQAGEKQAPTELPTTPRAGQ